MERDQQVPTIFRVKDPEDTAGGSSGRQIHLPYDLLGVPIDFDQSSATAPDQVATVGRKGVTVVIQVLGGQIGAAD
jgi:hypothetical protein